MVYRAGFDTRGTMARRLGTVKLGRHAVLPARLRFAVPDSPGPACLPLVPSVAALEHRYILGTRVDATRHTDAVGRVFAWAQARESRVVCVANAHMVMEAYDSPDFRRIVNCADLVTPDGMSLVWTMRRLGLPRQEQVRGADLTDGVCDAAEAHGLAIGFYGSTAQALQRLLVARRTRFPRLKIVYAWAPPFRPLTVDEERRAREAIIRSGTRILFVGLGCPKQERWMAAHKGALPVVMLGVGAAFHMHAGLARQAPLWMQRAGAEWLFRLLNEPRRLWRRYLKHNPRFAVLVGIQILGIRTFEELEG